MSDRVYLVALATSLILASSLTAGNPQTTTPAVGGGQNFFRGSDYQPIWESVDLPGLFDVVLDDADSDGAPDFIAAADGLVVFYENFGDDQYFPLTGATLGAFGNLVEVLVDDFDRDGRREFIVAHDRSTIRFFESDGDNSFLNVLNLFVPYEIDPKPSLRDIEIANTDGDGRMDLLVLKREANGDSELFIEEFPGFITSFHAIGNNFERMASGHFDADAGGDILVLRSGGGVTWFEAQGGGWTTKSLNAGGPLDGDAEIALRDLDFDGQDEFIVTSDSVRVYSWTQGNQAALVADLPLTGAPGGTSALTLARVGPNPFPQMLVGTAAGASFARSYLVAFSVLTNGYEVYYTNPSALSSDAGQVGLDVASVALGNADNDGRPDALVALADGRVVIMESQPVSPSPFH